MTITVRPALEEDIDPMLDTFEAVAREGRWIGTELPFDREERFRTWLEGLGDDRRGAMFAALIDGRIVGGAGVTRSADAHPLYLGMWVVREERRRGVGTALVRACIDFGRAIGAHKITLEVWPHNAGAIALYERFGFVKEGYLRRQWRRRSGELWDSVPMGLVLDDDAPGSPFVSG